MSADQKPLATSRIEDIERLAEWLRDVQAGEEVDRAEMSRLVDGLRGWAECGAIDVGDAERLLSLCKRALRTVRTGGQPLTPPNSVIWSKPHPAMNSVEGQIRAAPVSPGTLSPAAVVADALDRLAARLRRAEGLEWVKQGSSGEATDAEEHSEEPGRFFPARWYSKSTNQVLYPDKLRQAHIAGRIVRRKKARSTERNMYDLDSVCRAWPEYEDRLKAAADEPEA